MPDREFEGKVALVAGGSLGIGRPAGGAKVVAARRQPAIQEVVGAIRDAALGVTLPD